MPESKKQSNIDEEDKEENPTKVQNAKTNMELICKGDICRDKNGNIIVDLRETNCPPEMARAFIETISNPDATIGWKMPPLKKRKTSQIAWCLDCSQFAKTECFKDKHQTIYPEKEQ